MPRTLSTQARAKSLTAAHALVLERGIDGFNVEEVARRSGVAKSTIYRHWPSSHDLLVDTLSQLIDTFPTPNTGNLRDDLLAFFRHGLPLFTSPGMRSVVLGLMSAAAVDDDIRAVHERLTEERQHPMLIILELAVGRGELPADLDIALADDFVEGPIFRRVMVRDEPVTDDELQQLVDWAVAGLRSGALSRSPG